MRLSFAAVALLAGTPLVGAMCYLCEGGQLPVNSDFVIPADAMALFGELNTGETYTCGDAYSSLLFAEDNDETCQALPITSIPSYCGCPGAERTCSICVNGGSFKNGSRYVAGSFTGGTIITCDQVQYQFGGATGPLCSAVRNVYGEYCECTNNVASASTCRICGDDNLVINPTKIADRDDRRRCSDVEFDANWQGKCPQYQQNYGDVCCNAGVFATPRPAPTPPTPAPTAAPVTLAPTLPPTTTPPTLPPASTAFPSETPLEDTAKTAVQKTSKTSAPTASPNIAPGTYPVCQLCGAGQVVTNDDAIVNFGGDTITCAELERRGLDGAVPQDFCVVAPSFFLGDCGCNRTAVGTDETTTPVPAGENPVCQVCGPGRVVSKPKAQVNYAGNRARCGELEQGGLNGEIPAEFCNLIPPILGPCECVDDPSAPASTLPGTYSLCNVCGPGNIVTSPGTYVAFGENSGTCAQVQQAGLNGDISPDDCFKGPIYLGTCKCAPEGTTMAPTLAPVSFNSAESPETNSGASHHYKIGLGVVVTVLMVLWL